MRFEKLEEAQIINRERRFKLFIRYKNEDVLAYLPNPGRLENIILPGAPVLIRECNNHKRKTKYEAVLGFEDSKLVSLNASLANKIFLENIYRFPIKVKDLKREFRFGRSRFDFLINERILVEVKSVTLVKNGIGLFPDAPTERGAKHMQEMQNWTFEKWVVFVVQRSDAKLVKPNRELDLDFYNAIRALKENGGAFFAFTCNVTYSEITFKEFINVEV
ncbi:MAG: DNA/RNA nuclease SfsA [Dictyoglomus sp. NZ13-RE01]|nr:MAG: DNA/RNA nuclease SfsA [Dictyoglomus sp. NZ13-RE01]